MLTNNDILKKLRVALNLRTEEMLEIIKLTDFSISENELSAFFRSETDANYREAGDQVLRRFLDGLIIKNRGPRPEGAPVPRTSAAPGLKAPDRQKLPPKPKTTERRDFGGGRPPRSPGNKNKE